MPSENISRHSQQKLEKKTMRRVKGQIHILKAITDNTIYLGVAAITSLTAHITRFGTDADKGLSS